MEQQSSAIVSEFYAIFDGISERVAEELFDCFLHFWHGFWRFIKKWVGGIIENKPRRAPALRAPERAMQAGGLLARGKNKEEQSPDKKDIAQSQLPGRCERVGIRKSVISSRAIIEQMCDIVKQRSAARSS